MLEEPWLRVRDTPRAKGWGEDVWVQVAFAVVVGLGCLVLAGVFPWSARGIRSAPSSPVLQEARAISLCMFSYACDHGGKYPTGKSSTEVFQKLLDGDYVTDPAIFWNPEVPGKIKPVARKLKPENVCWDVTVAVDSTSPDHLPLVFLTGFKIIYAPGGSALPLFKSYSGRLPGIFVAYKSNSAKWIKEPGLYDGSIPGFISPDFVPVAGKTYEQVTPDGPLAP